MAGVELLYFNALLYSLLDGGEWWVYRTGRFTPKEQDPPRESQGQSGDFWQEKNI
jgi:hypothetical protein